MKIKKRRKPNRYRGGQTAKRGRRSRTRGSGNQGGVGMAGTGKRGDQKKTLVIKLTGGNNYFGKDKTLRRGNIAKKLDVINLSDIEKKYKDHSELIDLSGYKILAVGDIKTKLKIKAFAASKSALDKIKKAGGEISIKNFEEKEDKIKKVETKV
ncbi:MAG: uL15m family ribosomal protein [Nanoarchaeota archaeon]